MTATRMATGLAKTVGIFCASIGACLWYGNYPSTFSCDAPDEVASFESMKIVNPNHNKFQHDIFSIKLKTSKSNEQILASFTKGFFGGPCLFLERKLAVPFLKDKYQATGYTSFNNIEFDESKHDYSSSIFYLFPVDKLKTTIWDASKISTSKVLPVNTILFGIFQLLNDEVSSDSRSLDFGFGSDLTSFSGSHRFNVTRLSNDEVKVSLIGFNCNPTGSGVPKMWNIITYFHYFYAKILFNDAIKEILA